MGMFDELTCEHPLPQHSGVPDPGKNFQTKEFECYMEAYTITTGGRLLRGGVDTDYHGWLEFHEYRGRTWWSYQAKFTDGQLQAIELVESYTHTAPGEDDIMHYQPSVVSEETNGG